MGREMGGGGGVQDPEDICIPVTDSWWCMAEINTVLQNNYPPIKKKYKESELKLG